MYFQKYSKQHIHRNRDLRQNLRPVLKSYYHFRLHLKCPRRKTVYYEFNGEFYGSGSDKKSKGMLGHDILKKYIEDNALDTAAVKALREELKTAVTHTWLRQILLCEDEAELLVKEVSALIGLLPIEPADIKANLGTEHPDFEDSLQISAAKSWGADVIVTRDTTGFGNSPIKVLTPAEFLKII